MYPLARAGAPSTTVLQGTPGPALDKLLQPRQVLNGALTYMYSTCTCMPSNQVHCTCTCISSLSPTCALVECATASGRAHRQPRPGPKFTLIDVASSLGLVWQLRTILTTCNSDNLKFNQLLAIFRLHTCTCMYMEDTIVCIG